MLRGSTPGVRRHRQHGAVLQQHDRRDLERAGWRTTLDFRENLIRARDGRLLQVEPVWHAEAERQGSEHTTDFIAATAESSDEVWSRLRIQAELIDVRRPAVVSVEPRARAS